MITRIEMLDIDWGASIILKPPKSAPSWDKPSFSRTDEFEADEYKRYWNPLKAVFFSEESTLNAYGWEWGHRPIVEMAHWCKKKRLSLLVVANCCCYLDNGESENKIGFLFRKKEHAMRFRLSWQVI